MQRQVVSKMGKPKYRKKMEATFRMQWENKVTKSSSQLVYCRKNRLE
jgi:hypothetical protein